MAAVLSDVDLETGAHQVSKRQRPLGVHDPASSAGPEVNPNTRKAIFIDTWPEICLRMVF